MSAPLVCTRCGAAYEPVGANHTHDGLCPQCQPSRLGSALAAYDARQAAFGRALSAAEAEATVAKDDALLVEVADAFAEATADRNRPEVAREYVLRNAHGVEFARETAAALARGGG